MSPINIPYHLFLPFALGLGLLIFTVLKRKKILKRSYKKCFWLSFIVFLVVYLFFVGSSLFDNIYYQWDLNRYDLNQDGFFSGKELTPDQDKAMFRLTNDVGRNFSFITSLTPAFIVSSIYLVLGVLRVKFKKKV